MLIVALIIGCFVGFSFAYMMTGILVAKSNDHGDSKGNFSDFAQYPVNIIHQQNNIRRPKF